MHRDSENCRAAPKVGELPADCKTAVDRVYAECGAGGWGLSRDSFVTALERSALKHFSGAGTILTSEKLREYFGTLHLRDLALASACAEGQASAWDYFVSTYRSYLRAAASTILRSPATSPAACELADSLFADLYGLDAGKPSRNSLFRYFHGRSSLKTWLRAVLAQRHVDVIRAGRRFAELEDGDKPSSPALQAQGKEVPDAMRDPHRDRYVALFTRTLQIAMGLLEPRDKQRLRLYYAEESTLAEIGTQFGEHESSVSRNLERTRRELRLEVERVLRKGMPVENGGPAERGLSEAEVALCFEYAAHEAPIDFEKLFPGSGKQAAKVERKER